MIAPKEKRSLRKVDVWQGMTVQELAESSGRDINDVLDAILIRTRYQLFLNDVLKDRSIISNCLKDLNLAPVFISNPKKNSKTPADEKDKTLDVRR